MIVRILLVGAVLLSAVAGWAADAVQLERVQLMEPPLLAPARLNLYGPGQHGDATGQVFDYETEASETVTFEPVKPDAYGKRVAPAAISHD